VFLRHTKDKCCMFTYTVSHTTGGVTARADVDRDGRNTINIDDVREANHFSSLRRPKRGRE